MQKHLLKEHVELMVLEHLSRSQYAPKLAFIGGTNLRLVQGIDRFSEDLDFDIKGLTEDEFLSMTDEVVRFLQFNGMPAEVRDKNNTRLSAFRRSIYFPQWLFDLQLTGHRDERFLLKIEAQDQGKPYPVEMAHVHRNGFFFPIAVPPLGVLLSKKLTALLSRGKGRDFYDVLFLLERVQPDYSFLTLSAGISNPTQLIADLDALIADTDLYEKCRDFEHLLFFSGQSDKFLHFAELYKPMPRE